MAEEIDGNTGGAEEFVPAFTPPEAGNPVVDINEAKTITLPPELNPNPIGYEPSDAEIEAEAASSLDRGFGSNADARSDARARLIKRANMSSEELAADNAIRAEQDARAAAVPEIPPPPSSPVAVESAPTELREAVDRVVPDMPEGPSAGLTAAMAGENVKMEGLPQSELDKFVVEKELTPEDEAGLVTYAKIVIERGKAQVAGDWNKERKIREDQKKAYEGLTDKAKKVADAYASRYATDIKQKEAVAEAA